MLIWLWWFWAQIHEVSGSFCGSPEGRLGSPNPSYWDFWKILPFLEAKKNFCKMKSPIKSTYLHLSPEIVERTSDSTAKIGFLFNMDHIYTDGIGIRMLAGELFQLLSRILNKSSKDPKQVELSLEKPGIKLSPPYTSLMNEDQKTEGKSYELALTRQREFLLELLAFQFFWCCRRFYWLVKPKNWGLTVLPNRNAGVEAETQHHLHSFTKKKAQCACNMWNKS